MVSQWFESKQSQDIIQKRKDLANIRFQAENLQHLKQYLIQYYAHCAHLLGLLLSLLE